MSVNHTDVDKYSYGVKKRFGSVSFSANGGLVTIHTEDGEVTKVTWEKFGRNKKWDTVDGWLHNHRLYQVSTPTGKVKQQRRPQHTGGYVK